MDSTHTYQSGSVSSEQKEDEINEGLSWASLLKEHSSDVRQMVASKLGNEATAAVEDVMQEVHLAAHATPVDSIEKPMIRAWLRKVATHKVQDYWRAVERRRKLKQSITDHSVSSTAHSPADWVLKIEQQQQVQKCLGKLPDDDRLVLEQKYLHGRSYSDIADTLGISIKSVEYRLTRAREAMRELITSPPNNTKS